MANNIAPMPLSSKPTSVDHPTHARSTDVDQALACWRRSIQDCGYTLDALEQVMHKDRAYIGKVLNGDKPMTLAFQKALPDDVETRYHELSAEEAGLIVVAPVRGDEALRHLVSGLVGVLADRLPSKADRFAKADVIPTTSKKAGER